VNKTPAAVSSKLNIAHVGIPNGANKKKLGMSDEKRGINSSSTATSPSKPVSDKLSQQSKQEHSMSVQQSPPSQWSDGTIRTVAPALMKVITDTVEINTK